MSSVSHLLDYESVLWLGYIVGCVRHVMSEFMKEWCALMCIVSSPWCCVRVLVCSSMSSE